MGVFFGKGNCLSRVLQLLGISNWPRNVLASLMRSAKPSDRWIPTVTRVQRAQAGLLTLPGQCHVKVSQHGRAPMYTLDLGSLPTGPREASPARLRGQGHPASHGFSRNSPGAGPGPWWRGMKGERPRGKENVASRAERLVWWHKAS